MISSRLHIHIPLWQRNYNRLVTSVKASSGHSPGGNILSLAQSLGERFDQTGAPRAGTFSRN